MLANVQLHLLRGKVEIALFFLQLIQRISKFTIKPHPKAGYEQKTTPFSFF